MKKVMIAAAMTATLGLTTSAYAAGADREPIYVSAEQREFILTEMREFLETVQDIVLASAEKDMDTVVEVARKMAPGAGGGMGRQMGLNKVLPLEFRQMGAGTHRAFGELAQAAEFGPEGVLADLGTLMSNCTGCHATYQLVVKE